MNKKGIIIGLILAVALGGGLYYRSHHDEKGGEEHAGHTEAGHRSEKAGGHEEGKEHKEGEEGHEGHGAVESTGVAGARAGRDPGSGRCHSAPGARA